jgi:hypothetical protein
MRNLIFILALITFYVLMFNSCKKQNECVSNNLGNVSFSATDLQIVPYKGTETLIFSDSLGNTMTFPSIVRGSYEDYHVQYPNSNSDPNFCIGDYFYSQHIYIQSNGKNTLMWINLSMNDGSPFFQNINKTINIILSYENSVTWNFEQGFNFDGLKLYKPSDTTLSKLYFKDSLLIGERKFYSVYVMNQLKANLLFVY